MIFDPIELRDLINVSVPHGSDSCGQAAEACSFLCREHGQGSNLRVDEQLHRFVTATCN
jgi:hypothetical protein